MNHEFKPVTIANAGMLWNLISGTAERELSFSGNAIKHFREIFTDDELVRRYNDPAAPVFVIQQKNIISGALIGTAPEGGVGTVVWLVVAPECRMSGIGRSLFEKACGFYFSSGCHKIKLTASTRDAVSFYEKLGMNVEGFHPSHWWGLDFWSMGKLLR